MKFKYKYQENQLFLIEKDKEFEIKGETQKDIVLCSNNVFYLDKSQSHFVTIFHLAMGKEICITYSQLLNDNEVIYYQKWIEIYHYNSEQRNAKMRDFFNKRETQTAEKKQGLKNLFGYLKEILKQKAEIICEFTEKERKQKPKWMSDKGFIFQPKGLVDYD
ncbi:MAG: hypothetical protein GBAus27B_000177 [Mycoplasmataceae bacterium]|nr:MAG: hypothetical protein GBAus27B_000177 [Mycoplasmataceae bacterium]